MSHSERLKQLINNLLESPKSFSDGIGLASPTTVYDILGGRRDITPALMRKITETYPNINPEWLLKGEGPMILSEVKKDALNEPKSEYNSLKEALKEKDLIIENLNKIIEHQQVLIDQMGLLKNIK